ncbi:hypothetical protein V1478_008729 [Vespula squamosa]|uniref:Uncharacterized protein n=1 Tax=Vespula squamosa TaxID=30214 RepID=A0ABD2AUC5_VESSQ
MSKTMLTPKTSSDLCPRLNLHLYNEALDITCDIKLHQIRVGQRPIRLLPVSNSRSRYSNTLRVIPLSDEE